MIKLLKRLTLLVIALVAICSTSALAVSGTTGDWNWTATTNGITISSYTGTDTNVIIPDEVDDLPVIAIASRAFQNNTTMESVHIPDTVDSIGTYAFSGCTALKSVTIPEGVSSITGRAFQNCSALTSVSIPSTVMGIATGAFSGTSLTELSLPEDIDTVGNNAFPGDIVLLVEGMGGSLTYDSVDGVYTCIEYETNGVNAAIHAYTTPADTIYVPDTVAGYTVSNIDSGAFGSTTGTTKKLIADLNGTVAELLSDYGYVIYDPSDLTMGLKKENGNTVLAQYDGADTSITIPSYVDIIGSYAFNGNSIIASITVPSSATKSITIDNYAFSGASALANVYLPDNLTSVTTDMLPASLTYWCSRTSDTAKALGSIGYSFVDPSEPDFTLQWMAGTELTVTAYLGSASSVTIPAGVTEIAMDVFRGNTTITSVTLPEGLTTIHAGAFLEASNLTSITLPSSLTTIEALAFYGTGITDIVIPDNVSTIRGGGAPSPIVSGSYYDGYDYPSLPEDCLPHVNFHTTASRALSDAGYTFYKANDNLFGCRYIDGLLYLVKYNGEQDTIEVPEGIEGVAYVFGVYNKMTSVVFPSTLKVIGYEAFKNCSGLTSITIPSTVVEIGYEAFAGSALRSIRLPDNVNKVGEGAFRDCTNLASATFVVSGDNGVSVIGNYAFYNTGLRSVTIPTTTVSIGEYAFGESAKLATVNLPATGSLKTVGSYAFSGTAITSLTVPGTVTTIDSYAFSNCQSLKTATLSSGVQTIGYGTFSSDYALTTVTLNSGVKTIGDSAFSSCSALKEINIPSGVTSIGEWAFASTSALNTITLPDTVTSLGQYAFSYSNLGQGITLSSGLKTISSNTFEYSSISSIAIPDSVTTIGTYAFQNCYYLVDLTLSSKLTSLGTGAFNDCYSLTWVEIPSTVPRLYPSFDNCRSAIIILPDSVKYIQGIVFDDVRAVLGSRNNDILKSLDKFGYSDEKSFIYTYIGDDGVEDYDILRVVDYIGTDVEATLPSSVSIINNGAFKKCTQLAKLILPDTGLTAIGSDAFHSNLQVICTIGSDTYKILVAGAYPVEVAGYPGLYAVTGSDGKLYNASYRGNASIIDLPDNIVSTDIQGDSMGEWDELTQTYISEYYDTFPVTTRYRTTFDSLTASTLGTSGYFITVAGKEDFGFRKNASWVNYGGAETEERLSDNDDDLWYAARYYGTEKNPVIPTGIVAIYVDWLDVDAITIDEANISSIVSIINHNNKNIYITEYPDYAFGFSDYDNRKYEPVYGDYTGMYLKGYTGTDNQIVIDDQFPVQHIEDAEIPANIRVVFTSLIRLSYSLYRHDFYLSNYPDLPLRYDLDTSMFTVRDFTGTERKLTLRRDILEQYEMDFSGIPADVILYVYADEMIIANYNQDYFIKRSVIDPTHPEWELRYLQDDYSRLAYYRYVGKEKEVTIDDNFGITAFYDNAVSSDVKLYFSKSRIWFDFGSYYSTHDFFENYSFFMTGYPDIAFRWGKDGVYVYQYIGAEKEVLIDDFSTFDFAENAFPSDVKVYCHPYTIGNSAYNGMLKVFNTRDFYVPESPNLAFRFGDFCGYGQYQSTLYSYTGSGEDVIAPKGGNYVIKEGAIPSTVAVQIGDLGYYESLDWMNVDCKLIAEHNSTYVAETAESGRYLYTDDYRDVPYVIETNQIKLAGYTGDGKSVTLPGYYTEFCGQILYAFDDWTQNVGYDPSSDSYYDFNPFGVDVYVLPNTDTAKLLSRYGIPYNIAQTVKSNLPASLVTIEDEAFTGSVFEEVTIGSKCTTIGAYAFANSKSLVAIHIPSSVTSIDSTAFSGCGKVTIYCKSGSVAESFAINNGIPYVNE